MKTDIAPVVSPKLRAAILSLVALNALYLLWRPWILGEPRVVFTSLGLTFTLISYSIVIGRLFSRNRWIRAPFQISMAFGALGALIGPALIAFLIGAIVQGNTEAFVSVPYSFALGVSITLQGVLSYVAMRLDGPLLPRKREGDSVS